MYTSLIWYTGLRDYVSKLLIIGWNFQRTVFDPNHSELKRRAVFLEIYKCTSWVVWSFLSVLCVFCWKFCRSVHFSCGTRVSSTDENLWWNIPDARSKIYSLFTCQISAICTACQNNCSSSIKGFEATLKPQHFDIALALPYSFMYHVTSWPIKRTGTRKWLW